MIRAKNLWSIGDYSDMEEFFRLHKQDRLQIASVFVLAFMIPGMMIFPTLVNSSYAQEPPTIPNIAIPPNKTQINSKPTTPTAATSTVAHGVKITSPAKGQQVPIGELTVLGTSKDNATSNCHVSAIVNDVKPYQNASATGPHGASDYSKWKFSLNAKYALIKEGQNKITAKFYCNNNPGLASFYGVNVTGTAGKISPPSQNQSSLSVTTKAATTNVTAARNATTAHS
jgi:actin-related protein